MQMQAVLHLNSYSLTLIWGRRDIHNSARLTFSSVLVYYQMLGRDQILKTDSKYSSYIINFYTIFPMVEWLLHNTK